MIARRYAYTVVLTPPEPHWRNRADLVSAQIRAALGPELAELEVIGSRTLPGVWSKPCIDFIAVIGQSALSNLGALSFEEVEDLNMPGRMLFRQTDPLTRQPYVNLHVVSRECWSTSRERMFHRRLESSPQLAAAYSQCKRLLASLFHDDAKRYGEFKNQFIVWLEALPPQEGDNDERRI